VAKFDKCPSCGVEFKGEIKAETPPIKPGYKTTEFWVVILAALAAGLEGLTGILPAQTATIVAAIVAGLYAVSRGLTKSGSSS